MAEKQQIRVVKKKDAYSLDYSVGDVLSIDSTWYGGVNVISKTGIPLSLEREEYELLSTFDAVVKEDLELKEETAQQRDIRIGDIVQHFKREWVSPETSRYLYKVLTFASHTETGEKLVIYQALYPPYKTCARPYSMFMSEVDRSKYPDIRQQYRFQKVETEPFPV